MERKASSTVLSIIMYWIFGRLHTKSKSIELRVIMLPLKVLSFVGYLRKQKGFRVRVAPSYTKH